MAKRLTDNQIVCALQKCGGLISHTAKALGCGRTILYSRIQKSATLKKALEDAREETADDIECELIKNAKAGKEASIFFYLKCLGKARGYVEKQIIENHFKTTNEEDTNRAMAEALGLIGQGLIGGDNETQSTP